MEIWCDVHSIFTSFNDKVKLDSKIIKINKNISTKMFNVLIIIMTDNDEKILLRLIFQKKGCFFKKYHV